MELHTEANSLGYFFFPDFILTSFARLYQLTPHPYGTEISEIIACELPYLLIYNRLFHFLECHS